MTSKELIRQLQTQDPKGECQVVVDGSAIHFVDRLAAFYDGPVNELIEDESKRPYYAITGYKIRRNGPDKLMIKTMTLEDVLLDNIDATIIVEGDTADGAYLKGAEKLREQLRGELK